MIRYAIVGHYARLDRVRALDDELSRQGVSGSAWIDGIPGQPKLGANGNHRRALSAYGEVDGHVVVLEDDALLSPDFVARTREWIGRFPDDLISFYLGTGHPEQWQPKVLAAIEAADRDGADHIMLPKLIHAVCYAMPTDAIPHLLKIMKRTGNVDYNIGDAWRRLRRREVIYAIPSLVDHDDDIPSLLQQRRHPRRAHRLT